MNDQKTTTEAGNGELPKISPLACNDFLSANVALRVTDALLTYTEKRTNKLQALEVLVSELVAAVAELDARTAHVQR